MIPKENNNEDLSVEDFVKMSCEYFVDLIFEDVKILLNSLSKYNPKNIKSLQHEIFVLLFFAWDLNLYLFYVNKRNSKMEMLCSSLRDGLVKELISRNIDVDYILESNKIYASFLKKKDNFIFKLANVFGERTNNPDPLINMVVINHFVNMKKSVFLGLEKDLKLYIKTIK